MVETYLSKIVDDHRRAELDDTRDVSELLRQAAAQPPPRGFRSALAGPGVSVIAEVKRRSPSKGELAPGLDPGALARTYEAGGAACLSVLTDEAHFGGSRLDLQAAWVATSLPVLRKDFTVSVRDVCDARLMGADAVLLIVTALTAAELMHFHSVALDLGLDVLVEVHDDRELSVALALGATMIGVNQRDLTTFQVDPERAVRLAASIPDGVVKVAESGITGPHDIDALAEAGYHAVLVGEHLVTAPDPAAAVRALRRD
jgi:indole-3-glycerol phosphate synthase